MSSNAGCPSHMSICRRLVGFDIRSGRHVAGGDRRAGRDNADIRVCVSTSSVSLQPLQHAAQPGYLWVVGSEKACCKIT